MKKRLRKKLHQGEFIQKGFRVYVLFEEDIDREKWLDDFLEMLESNGMQTFGSQGKTKGTYEVEVYNGTVTPEQLARVTAWLEADVRICNHDTTQLHDNWGEDGGEEPWEKLWV